jgi:formylglycine-generating enzyme required for sulfatase activity
MTMLWRSSERGYKPLKRILGALVLFFLTAITLGWQEAAAAEAQKRVALVIANEAYAAAPISNTASIARDIAQVLRQGGFDVVYAENASTTDMTNAFQSFAGKIEKGAVAVVYYSGYAAPFQDRNVLIAVDAKTPSEADMRSQGLDMDLLLDPMIVARSPGSVVIVDASRPSPWTRSGPAAGAPIKNVSVILPAAPGKLASNVAFAPELVKAMKAPGLGFDAVISRTRAAVSRASGGQQTVWQSSAPPKELVVLEREAPAGAADAVELGFWDTIKASDKAADLQAYLDSYPQGQFSAMAKARLALLQSQKTETSPTRNAAPVGEVQPPSPAVPVRDCPVCPELVPIPAGDFEMGATDGFPFERPIHRVAIRKPFYIGRREVTFDEWDACVNEGGCQYRAPNQRPGRGLRPVTNVDWNDAKTFLSWLSAKTGHFYRLPSEAEWEYAARAGTKTAYFWGGALEKDRANCTGCTSSALGAAAETGAFPANGFGLFDMAGNAAEWVEDCWSETYSGAPSDGSAWVKPNCRERVLRGGSFNNDARFVRSAARFKYDFDVRYYTNGFRVVRE